MNRVQNIRAEICKSKYNQERLLIIIFASTTLVLDYKFDAIS